MIQSRKDRNLKVYLHQAFRSRLQGEGKPSSKTKKAFELWPGSMLFPELLSWIALGGTLCLTRYPESHGAPSRAWVMLILYVLRSRGFRSCPVHAMRHELGGRAALLPEDIEPSMSSYVACPELPCQA